MAALAAVVLGALLAQPPLLAYTILQVYITARCTITV